MWCATVQCLSYHKDLRNVPADTLIPPCRFRGPSLLMSSSSSLTSSRCCTSAKSSIWLVTVIVSWRITLLSTTYKNFHYKYRCNLATRAVFKWLSKVSRSLWLLRLVTGLKRLVLVFQPMRNKNTTNCTLYVWFFTRFERVKVIARNCDWFMALFVHVVIGRSNCFGFGFSTVIWKPLYYNKR